MVQSGVLTLLCSLSLCLCVARDRQPPGDRPTPSARTNYKQMSEYMTKRGFQEDSPEAFNYVRSVAKSPVNVVQTLIWMKKIGA